MPGGIDVALWRDKATWDARSAPGAEDKASWDTLPEGSAMRGACWMLSPTCPRAARYVEAAKQLCTIEMPDPPMAVVRRQFGGRPPPKRYCYFFDQDPKSRMWRFPRGIFRLLKVNSGPVVHWRGRDVGDARYTCPTGLFPFQQAVVDSLHQWASSIGSGLAVMPCGTGKSEVIAKMIADCTGVVWVLVPDIKLSQQLAASIRERCPGRSVAVLNCKSNEVGANKDVVVCVARTYCGIMANPALRDKHGARDARRMLIDEAHHVPSDKLFAAVSSALVQDLLLLTATPDRVDGLGLILYLICGGKCIQTYRPPIRVEAVRLRTVAIPSVGDKTHNPIFNHGILQAVHKALTMERVTGRVLVLVDGVLHLLALYAAARGTAVDQAMLHKYRQSRKQCANSASDSKHAPPQDPPAIHESLVPASVRRVSHGIIVGLQGGRLPPESHTAKVVWATYQSAKEGMDQKGIDVVVFAVRGADTQQGRGRNLRLACIPERPVWIFVHPRGGGSSLDKQWSNVCEDVKQFPLLSTRTEECSDCPAAAVRAYEATHGEADDTEGSDDEDMTVDELIEARLADGSATVEETSSESSTHRNPKRRRFVPQTNQSSKDLADLLVADLTQD